MSFQDSQWDDPRDWFVHPDPNRENYYMVHMTNSLTRVVMHYPIHANKTGTEGDPGYVSAKDNAMAGAEALNPGWAADWAHHQFESPGVFSGGQRG